MLSPTLSVVQYDSSREVLANCCAQMLILGNDEVLIITTMADSW